MLTEGRKEAALASAIAGLQALAVMERHPVSAELDVYQILDEQITLLTERVTAYDALHAACFVAMMCAEISPEIRSTLAGAFTAVSVSIHEDLCQNPECGGHFGLFGGNGATRN